MGKSLPEKIFTGGSRLQPVLQSLSDELKIELWPVSCSLRNLWMADPRIFPLDSCPEPVTGRWKRTPLERLVVPVNTGTLDGNGRAQVTVQTLAGHAHSSSLRDYSSLVFRSRQ